jgi:hypothetical protein
MLQGEAGKRSHSDLVHRGKRSLIATRYGKTTLMQTLILC